MSLSKEQFATVIAKLVTKFDSNEAIRFYIDNNPTVFEYQAEYLGYYIDNKCVMFIDIVSTNMYFEDSERIQLLDIILKEAKKIVAQANESENLLRYYLSQINSL